MSKIFKLFFVIAILLLGVPVQAEDGLAKASDDVPIAFADAGKIKMLYDARQRPQSVLLKDRVFIVFNGDARWKKPDKASAFPMMIVYDTRTRKFSTPVRLSNKDSTDHHYCPIIWADKNDFLHVLHGCHRTPGTHLISKSPVGDDTIAIQWIEGPQIAPSISYPTVFRTHDDREVIYFRTGGHTSSWTYLISNDDGRTWTGPERDVTDLDSQGVLDWSSYQTKWISRDRKSLHVVYTDYDDNKHSPDPQRFFNPRYDELVSNEWKYNLSYVNIDLDTHRVRNSDGQELKAPIDIDYSKSNCQIWDTQWRGAGVPPAVAINEIGDPIFLHVLSEASTTEHNYYFVRKIDGQWKKSVVTKSNHQWNSCHLRCKENGELQAFVVTGEGYLQGGLMDRHGGGRIEQWVSTDQGENWTRRRDLFENESEYVGWRFNNPQPIVRPDGSIVDDMLIFYGWSDGNEPNAKAFLLHETPETKK